MADEVWLVALAWAVAGWGVGLGLNPVIHHLPRDLPIAARPRCEKCAAPIPLLGLPRWSACSGCGERVPYDRVEWLLAGLFALLGLYFGFGSSLLVHSAYTAVLLVIAMVDWRHRYVYTIIIYPSLLVGLVLTPLAGAAGLVETVAGVLVGGGLFGAVYAVGRRVYPGTEPLAKGDIEIAALAGAMVGVVRVLSALVLGVFVSGLFAAALLVTRRLGRRDYIPYGPGLCIGTFLAFFL
jgi:prepilin signal peptidase PulO-like enzyme (type II secretory pathway)